MYHARIMVHVRKKTRKSEYKKARNLALTKATTHERTTSGKDEFWIACNLTIQACGTQRKGTYGRTHSCGTTGK